MAELENVNTEQARQDLENLKALVRKINEFITELHKDISALVGTESFSDEGDKTIDQLEKKKKEITDLYKQLAARMTNDGLKKALQAEGDMFNAFLSTLFEKNESFIKLFEDSSAGSFKALKSNLKEVDELLDYAEGKKDAKLPEGISEEDAQKLKGDPKQIKELRKALRELRGEFRQTGDMEEFEKAFKNLFKAIRSGNKNDLGGALIGLESSFSKVKNSITQIGGSLDQIFGHKIGHAVNQTMELVGATMSVGKGVGQMFSGDILGGITSVVSGVATFFKMGKKVRSENMEMRRALDAKELDATLGLYDLNRERRQNYDWRQKPSQSTLSYLTGKGEQLTQQSRANEREQAELMEKLSGTSYITSETFRHGTWFRKGKVITEWEQIGKMSWEQIEELAASGKLSEEGKKYYEALKKAKEEGDELADRQEEYLKEMQEAYTGTTNEKIVTSIVEGFKAGKRSAADFADTFEELMKGAVIAALSLKADEKVRDWFDAFGEATDDGTLTTDEQKELKKMWDAIIAGLSEDAENLEKVTGIKIGGSSRAEGVTGQLKAEMTEGTASQLVGLWTMTASDTRLIREATMFSRQHLSDILQQSYLIEHNTALTAENTLQTVNSLTAGFGKLDSRLASIETHTRGYTGRG